MNTLTKCVRREPVALLALFVALGGTSYAADRALARNSVGSAQVVDHSLLAKDFKRGQVPKGAPGPRGSNGSVGKRGTTGVQGAAGATVAVVGGATGTPPTAPTTTLQTVSVQAAGQTKLLVEGDLGSAQLGCTPHTNCAATFGLYLDGAPVPMSATILSVPCPGSTECFGSAVGPHLFGIATVGAGSHTLALAWKSTGAGTILSLIQDTSHVDAMVLG